MLFSFLIFVFYIHVSVFQCYKSADWANKLCKTQNESEIAFKHAQSDVYEDWRETATQDSNWLSAQSTLQRNAIVLWNQRMPTTSYYSSTLQEGPWCHYH